MGFNSAFLIWKSFGLKCLPKQPRQNLVIYNLPSTCSLEGCPRLDAYMSDGITSEGEIVRHIGRKTFLQR